MSRWLRRRIGRHVLVTTVRDSTFEGCLMRDMRDGLVLVGAKLHDREGEHPFAGELFVPRAEVAFVQHEG